MEYLGENKPVNSLQPLVSVCIMTYQHGKYIKDCLEGAIIQKTSFPIEILIGEDESTDGTREICKEYAEKYPDKIRLFLRSRKDVIQINGKSTGRFNLLQTLKTARGKYIALCEGDDYWSDPLKLQKQVDFLEAHPDFAVCFHAAYELHEGREKRISNSNLNKDVFTIEDLAKGNFLHTPTVVYRNIFKGNFPEWFNRIGVGDYPLHMLHSNEGKIKFISEPLGYYRVHGSGAWSGLNQRESKIRLISVLDILMEGSFKAEIINILIVQRRKYVNELLDIDLNANWDEFSRDLKQFAGKDEELLQLWMSNSVQKKSNPVQQSVWQNRLNRLRNIFRK